MEHRAQGRLSHRLETPRPKGIPVREHSAIAAPWLSDEVSIEHQHSSEHRHSREHAEKSISGEFSGRAGKRAGLAMPHNEIEPQARAKNENEHFTSTDTLAGTSDPLIVVSRPTQEAPWKMRMKRKLINMRSGSE